MTKFSRIIILIIALLAFGIVSQAQDEETRSILDLAVETEDLSTLVAAVQAADPAIAEALAGEESYTVFAPSNQAFTNLLATLGIDAETLLADENLSAILQYHVVAGEVFAADLVNVDGGFVETILPDNFVAVSIADDGTVVLNDVVTVVTADIDASNGIVHIIDDVLLPQSALEAFSLVAAKNTNVQVLHFSPDAPNVDVYVDGILTFENLAFGEATGYVTVAADTYEVVVSPTGTSIDDAVIGPVMITFNTGEFVNIAAIGSVEAGTLNATLFSQSLPLLETDEFGLTVLHAVEGAPSVDLVLNNTVVIEELAYPFTDGTNDGAFNLVGTLPIDSLTVNVTGEDTVLLDLSDTAIEAGTYYLVVVGGATDAPIPYLYSIVPERAEELSDALFDDMNAEDMDMEATEEPMMNGTIADIVIANATAETDAEFTILLAAVQNADPAILEALQGTDALTVFAPTDEAFTNLLSATGLTAEELLASDLLTDILLYHVVLGEVYASNVVALDGESVPTLLEDAFIGVSVDDAGNVMLNDIVGLVATDIQADNGVIHIIDEVLLPQAVLEALGL